MFVGSKCFGNTFIFHDDEGDAVGDSPSLVFSLAETLDPTFEEVRHQANDMKAIVVLDDLNQPQEISAVIRLAKRVSQFQ